VTRKSRGATLFELRETGLDNCPNARKLVELAAKSSQVDVSGLARLCAHKFEVMFASTTPAARSMPPNGSNYRQVTHRVVIPGMLTTSLRPSLSVVDSEFLCFARGGGTSLAGQCCNVAGNSRFLQVHGEYPRD